MSRVLHKPRAPQEQLLGASSDPARSSPARLASVFLLTNGGPSGITHTRSTRPRPQRVCGGRRRDAAVPLLFNPAGPPAGIPRPLPARLKAPLEGAQKKGAG